MTLPAIFDTMDYGPAPENTAGTQAWLDQHGRSFGHFIDGAMTAPCEGFDSRNPANGEHLATLTQATEADIDAAVAAARRAQPKWAGLTGHQRARHLYALARLVQKHARYLAVLESLDNGKPIRESRDIDLPLVARHFYHHAGIAQLMPSERPDRVPLGVCGQIIPWNFPLLMLAWKVAPALAAGNTVVLKPAEYTSLTALRFAELCIEAGLPKGVVNIVIGDGRVGEAIVNHCDVDKIAFIGSTSVGRRIWELTAGTGKSLTLELGGKSPYIVFDDADLDSAVEGLVDAIWFNQGQVCCAGSRLLVQEGIAEQFHAKVKRRMAQLRVGDPLDKAIDMGAIVDPAQLARISGLVASSSGDIHQAPVALPAKGCFYPPTIITGLEPSDRLMQEKIFGPVLVGTTFRTPAETVEIANNTHYGLAATIWTENVNLALDMAPKLAAGVVWVNATDLFDAAAGFGGMRESGFGREGGWEGLSAYTRPAGTPRKLASIQAIAAPAKPRQGDAIDRTAKLYTGGKQTRPDGGYSKPVWSTAGALLGHAPIANRKDMPNAVEAARNASSWSRTTGYARAQILYLLAENLTARGEEFTQRLLKMTGATRKRAESEVETAVSRLFTWAAWADKHDGAVKPVPMRAAALAMNEPVGVIEAFCPDEAPLLGLVSVLGPILAMGNRAVLVASEPFPLAATDLIQVLETSDIPPGVINILTGSHAELAPALAGHLDVDALWSFSSTTISGQIERSAAGNLKRTWVNHGRARDWFGSEGETRDFLSAATEVKTIWVPYSE